MGRKDNKTGAASPKDEAGKVSEEDTPLIKQMKVLDDKIHEKAKALEQEIYQLRKQFNVDTKEFLEKRTKTLAEFEVNADATGTTGTPACVGFWCQAMKNHPGLEEFIHDHDEAVLKYLTDITFDDIDQKTFKLSFHFAENDFFEHKVLTMEVVLEENLYNGEQTVERITCDAISWKPGKNVTVEKVAKKVKGGGAKKAKQKAKETIEPRDSFFRRFLCTYEKGKPIPEQIKELPEMEEIEDDDEEDALADIMDGVAESAAELKERVIPYAVRWYTGEAAPSDDEDEDEEEEEEDSDDDSDEEEAPRGKKATKTGKGAKGAGSPALGPKGTEKQEECKQQ